MSDRPAQARVTRRPVPVPFLPTPPASLAPLRAISISHRTVGLGALPGVSLGCDAAMALHGALTAGGTHSVVLVTCNRTEVYWQSRGVSHDRDVRGLVAHALGAPGARVVGAAEPLAGPDAARHLMRVCAGLESLVVGEAEVLGQVRAALDACPGAGAFLTGVVRAAVRAGRMARAETAIGVGAQSVATAAVRMLARAMPLPVSRVLVVGAGDTGARIARHLRALGAGALTVLNRTPARAAALALEGAETGGLERLPAELARADAVLCAVAVTSPVLSAATLASAVACRGGRPLTVVDLSVPAAVAPVDLPAVAQLDLAAVEREVAAERERRAAEVPKVEAVVARELAMLDRWASRRAARALAPGPRAARAEAAG
jgi:glutamyl-tRNA reductase